MMMMKIITITIKRLYVMHYHITKVLRLKTKQLKVFLNGRRPIQGTARLSRFKSFELARTRNRKKLRGSNNHSFFLCDII